MGRLADARRMARRGGVTEPAPETKPEAAPPEPPAAAQSPGDFVFPAEPQDREPSAAERVSLPSSGLAEEILARIATAPAPEAAAPEAPKATRIELPASGLAEDILARHEGALPDARPTSTDLATPAELQPPAVAAGAHSLSFFAAPAQEQRAATEATEHLATFFLDREEYGLDVRQVQEIRRLTEVTAVPRAPGFIRGVINLRGRILPVLDLRAKLGLGEVADSRAARIIVVRVRERTLGLLVDGASQVLKVPISQIEPPPEEVVERGGDYIRGVAKRDDRLIILVDLERLLAHELRASASPSGVARSGLGPDA